LGIYIPGGTAPSSSTALLTIHVLPWVGGCKEIVVCTPADGMAHQFRPFLFRERARAGPSGKTEIYRVGGAQAIAAMALRTGTIRRCRRFSDPKGNAYDMVGGEAVVFRPCCH